MRYKDGFSLIELVVVLVIVAVLAGFAFINFNSSMEQARAVNARNNLLAIYSAQQNYLSNNNTTVYCLSTTTPNPCDSLADINIALSLNIQDDGSYKYQCPAATTTCTATRNLVPIPLTLTLTLNAQTQLVNQVGNPSCASTTGNANWCP